MIKVIIVDDETNGREVLKQLLKKNFDDIEIIGMAHSIESAVKTISFSDPDIVFLDIEMPNGSGFDILKRLEQINFEIIFVTAHQHYAIKAIKQSAIDYIVKPIDIDDLRIAIERYRNKKKDTRMKYGNSLGNTNNDYSIGSGREEQDGEIGNVSLGELLTFNHIFREIKDKEGKVVYSLTKKESQLLTLLIEFKQTYLKREHALIKLWGENDYYTARSMDVYIAKLRKALEKNNIRIINIYGDGFRIIY
jgi:DNA-binding response OmpR family regulator